ncbi:MAG: phage holin, lambda family [Porticoccaceae bacterium]|nr:phage holin, lambda family [Porticoccaceae bacterium]
MPEKDPGFWSVVSAWLTLHAPVIYGACMSVVIAMLRVIYSGGGVRQQLLEGTMCGAMTLAVVGGFDLFGLPQSAAVFVGGVLGFLGVEQVRHLAAKFIGAKFS